MTKKTLEYNSNLYERLITKYGTPAQINQVIQECAELIVTLTKIGQIGYTDEVAKNIKEELIQVQIMLFEAYEIFEIEPNLLIENEEIKIEAKHFPDGESEHF